MIKLKTDLGYLGKFSDLQKGKVNIQLEKLVRYNNMIHSYRSYIAIRVLEGFNNPEVKENYSYYKRDGEKTKPKNLYMLCDNDNNEYIELNKTLFNFAKWLVDNGLTTEEKIVEADNIEFLKLEKIKQDQEKIMLEEQQKEEELERVREQFEIELEEKINSYNNVEKLELAEKIHLDSYGEFYARSARMMLVLIDNFDKEFYKKKAKSILHLDNKASRKIFEHVTGLKLPNTLNGTMEYLESVTSKDFTDMKEFKARKKQEQKEVKLEKFYIRKGVDGSNLIVAEGEKINHLDLDLYIKHNADGSYSITEATTGVMLIGNDTNKARLLKTLKEKVNADTISIVKENIENVLKKFGEITKAA